MLLNVINLERRHTAENIKTYVTQALRNYHLNYDDIFRVVEDKAANMIRAFQKEQFVESLFFSEHDGELEYTANLEDGNVEYIADDDPLERVDYVFEKYHRCPIHTLMLSVKEALEEDESCRATQDAVFAIVKRVHNSHVMMQQLSENSWKVLLKPAPTRWLSILTTHRQ